MKFPKIFGVVIYLNYVNSYLLNGFDKGPKLISGSLNKPGSDHSLVSKMNRKRYTGMGEANDLLNSYFKIGSHSDMPAQSSDVDNASLKLTSIQPTVSLARKEKKMHVEYVDRLQRASFDQQTPRANIPNEKTEALKNLEIEPSKVVKRPIIVVGRVRKGSGGWPARSNEEFRERRKIGSHF